MTTIVTNGQMVVADTTISQGGIHLGWGVAKLREQRYPLHVMGAVRSPGDMTWSTRIFAFCGNIAMFAPWVDWWSVGHDPKAAPKKLSEELDHLWIFEGGKLLEVNSGAPYPIALGMPSAMGSGEKYAYGALALGHTPVEALYAASQCDPQTGSGVQAIELPEHLRISPQPRVDTWDTIDPRSLAPRSTQQPDTRQK